MSIKLGLSLDPEIERVLDTRCCGLSTERPVYAGEGLIRWEPDTGEFVFFTELQQWTPLFNGIQTNPYVVGLIESVGSDLAEIHRRLNDYAADRTNTQETFDRVFATINDTHQRVEDFVGRLNAVEEYVPELHRRLDDGLSNVYQRLEFIDARSASIKSRLEEFESRLIVIENAHHNTDGNTDGDPPLSVV